MKKIIVIGGGISGASLAWYLSKDPSLKITLLEKKENLGGYIQTVNENGFLFEKGARTFKPSRSRSLLSLIEELQLSDQIIASDPKASSRYIFQHDRLYQLPKGPFSFFLSPLTRGIIPALLKEWNISPKYLEDESIYDFISRRFNDKVARNLFDPMTLGIYAGDIKRLSIRSCFPELYNLEKQAGSLSRGLLSQLIEKAKAKKDPFIEQGFSRGSLFTLKEGMQSLMETLALKLASNLILNCEVRNIEGDKVITNKGEFDFDHLFIATDLLATTTLLEQINPQAAKVLRTIDTVSLIVVNLGYNEKLMPYSGFGHLVPSFEKSPVLGVVWDSEIFPKQNLFINQTRLSVMIGGAAFPEAKYFSKAQCIEIAKKALCDHLNIKKAPDHIQVHFATDAIAQYEVGHFKKIKEIQRLLGLTTPKITLLGNYLDGISVDYCIKKAKEIANRFTFEKSSL